MEDEVRERLQRAAGKEDDFGHGEDDAGGADEDLEESRTWEGGLAGEGSGGEEEEREMYAWRLSNDAQIEAPRRMHMKSSWMIQKGMRTDFNQGDLRGELLAVGVAIAARVDGFGTWGGVEIGGEDLLLKLSLILRLGKNDVEAARSRTIKMQFV